MEKNGIDTNEDIPSIHILLPICIQSTNDVFFNILRVVIARSKMDNFRDIAALKMGMMLESLELDSDEIVVHWKDLSSELQQRRQATMIGFWAIKNFPSLGKKLFGNSWQATLRKSVRIDGQKSMTPDEFDAFIFEKMKLRLMELRVSSTTLSKLNHFVKAPIDIAKSNRLQISQKVVSFDIESEIVQQCWDALKSGIFTLKRSSNVGENIEAGEDIEVVEPPTDEDLRLTYSNSSTESIEGVAKRRRTDNYSVTDALDELTNESLRSILLEIQKDIGSLKKLVEPTVSGNESEEGSQRLHIMIIKEKNEEIARMKSFADDLRKEIENLKVDKLGLLEQVENNASLISSLQKGVDAIFKLHTTSETDLAASHDVIDKQKQTIEQYETKIASLESQSELQNRVRILNEHLSAAEKVNEEMETKNREFERLLNDWRSYGATKDKEIEEAKELVTEKDAEIGKLRDRLESMNNDVDAIVGELKKHIENLEQNYTETTAKKCELEGILSDWQSYGATKDKEIEEAKKMVTVKDTEIRKLRDQLDSLNNDVTVIVGELKKHIENLEQNFTETTAKKCELEGILSDWQSHGATKDKEIEETKKLLTVKNAEIRKLRDQLEPMNNDVDVIVTELDNHINNLERNCTETTAKQCELDRLEEATIPDNATSTANEIFDAGNCSKNLKNEKESEVTASEVFEAGSGSKNLENHKGSEEIETDDLMLKDCRDGPLKLPKRVRRRNEKYL